jgi:hypothetical protein
VACRKAKYHPASRAPRPGVRTGQTAERGRWRSSPMTRSLGVHAIATTAPICRPNRGSMPPSHGNMKPSAMVPVSLLAGIDLVGAKVHGGSRIGIAAANPSDVAYPARTAIKPPHHGFWLWGLLFETAPFPNAEQAERMPGKVYPTPEPQQYKEYT